MADANNIFYSEFEEEERKEISKFKLEHQLYKPKGKARSEIEIQIELLELEKLTGINYDKKILY